ncbi:SemiSWEET transporter [Fervidibacillus albus]|uniref:SemiSWEET transporter n=1 Tax=Fervidibacillus albus TaxID=2980026 RepID=A0A9E8LVL3_9BACI|nr:SemiSWEET transporter [Fervidibacillus albus]WAA10130.1 SemiSWEET transporter [Fervidibacillus albus]
MDTLFSYIGYIASIFTTLSFLPQAAKTIKERNTEGISLIMYAMFTLGVFMWSIYGLYKHDIAILVGNSITFLFAIIILSVKIKNEKAKKQQI